jgi:hypothetical protein
VLTFGGAATNTPLPPMPEFKKMLSFGGGGAPGWGCADYEYPGVPNNINMIANTGKNLLVCAYLKGLDPARQMKVSLTQLGGEGRTLVSKNLLLDKNGMAVLWEQSLLGGVIEDWNAGNSVRFSLVIWWPVTFSPGSWRISIYQDNGFRVSNDFQMSQVSGAYIDALDPALDQEVIPGSPWADNHIVHLGNAGTVKVQGAGYPPNTPVYLLVYLENGLVQTKVAVSDGSGMVFGEFSGLVEGDGEYLLYGITDPNTKLDGTDHVTCQSILQSVAGAACDYFEIRPAIVRSSCPGAPPQRMNLGYSGRVCTQSDSVRLRSAPARSASTLMQLEPETYFKVIGGPACSDNWSWWNIQLSDGTTGWVSEGGDEMDQYFICPN